MQLPCRTQGAGHVERSSSFWKKQDLLNDLDVNLLHGVQAGLSVLLGLLSVKRLLSSICMYTHTLLPHFGPSLPPRLPPLFFECPVFLKCQVFQMYRFGNPEIVEESWRCTKPCSDGESPAELNESLSEARTKRTYHVNVSVPKSSCKTIHATFKLRERFLHASEIQYEKKRPFVSPDLCSTGLSGFLAGAYNTCERRQEPKFFGVKYRHCLDTMFHM